MITLTHKIKWKNIDNNVPEQEYSILSKFQVPALQYYCQNTPKKESKKYATYHVVSIKSDLGPNVHQAGDQTFFFLDVDRRMREKHDIIFLTVIHTFRVEELGPTRCCLRLTKRSCIQG